MEFDIKTNPRRLRKNNNTAGLQTTRLLKAPVDDNRRHAETQRTKDKMQYRIGNPSVVDGEGQVRVGALWSMTETRSRGRETTSQGNVVKLNRPQSSVAQYRDHLSNMGDGAKGKDRITTG